MFTLRICWPVSARALHAHPTGRKRDRFQFVRADNCSNSEKKFCLLITENETSRTFVIYAEPWVKPMAHPFVMLAKNERKGTVYAAESV